MIISDYEIGRELSRGPLTTVYRGKQKSLNRDVLIKMLNKQWQNETDLTARFRREATICARLKHPNIVSIFDVCTEPDQLYLVIEFIDGQNLRKLIRNNHPLPPSIILFISKEMVKGLAHAHARKVIHRDLKPSNVMISNDGEVKIADFGLARMEDLPAITIEGSTVGTPAYMSPEQARGVEVDYSSDIFSCGAAFYALATGASPFQGKNFAESIQNVLETSPSPLHDIRPDLPAWYSELVTEMMQKESGRRPQSAKSILKRAEIERIPHEQELLATYLENPDVFEEQAVLTTLMKQQPRNGLWYGAAAVLALVAMILFVAPSMFERASPGQTSDSNFAGALLDTISVDGSLNNDVESDVQTVVEGAPEPENDIEPVFVSTETTLDKPDQEMDTIATISPAPLETNVGSRSTEDTTARLSDSLMPPSNSSPLVAATGFLFISCTPWADVFIDNEKVDTTPLHEPLALDSGSYTIELRNPHFETHSTSIQVQPGQVDTLAVSLQSADGYLDLRITPWADVYVNGAHVGMSPLSEPLRLPGGKYEIRLTNPNFPVWEDSLNVISGEVTQHVVGLDQ